MRRSAAARPRRGPVSAARGRLRVFPFLLLAALATSCTSTSPQTRLGPAPAGHLFQGPFVDIRAPASDGWHLAGSSSLGMEFARKGGTKNQTFGAQVLMFPWRDDRGPDGFLSQVKQAIEADWRLDRYEKIESEIPPSDRRGLSCVSFKARFRDKFALTAGGRREPLLMQIGALYCMHPSPNYAGSAFAIIYSHRGPSLHPGFAQEARDFIDGVRVPGKPS